MKFSDAKEWSRIIRYIINGGVATLVHFSVLTLCVEVLTIPLVGLSNMLASCFGIAASFLGNRYFVFLSANPNILGEFKAFFLLYVVIALFHGAILFVWSDVFAADYRIGFLLATVFQFICSYIGNKNIVFMAAKAEAGEGE